MSEGAPDRSAPPALPTVWRPLGPRVAGGVAGGALVVVMVFLWIGFDDETRAAVTPFQRGTVLVIFGLGLLVLYALMRSRVEARADGLVVVNGYRRRHYDWAEIVAVRMPPGAPWMTLDLADGTSAPALAIQGSDGARARSAVRALRTLVDAGGGAPERPRDDRDDRDDRGDGSSEARS